MFKALNIFFRFQSSALAHPSEFCFQGQKDPHAVFKNILHAKGHRNVFCHDSAVFSILQKLKGMTENPSLSLVLCSNKLSSLIIYTDLNPQLSLEDTLVLSLKSPGAPSISPPLLFSAACTRFQCLCILVLILPCRERARLVSLCLLGVWGLP